MKSFNSAKKSSTTKFKILEGSDQKWSCPDSALLAVKGLSENGNVVKSSTVKFIYSGSYSQKASIFPENPNLIRRFQLCTLM